MGGSNECVENQNLLRTNQAGIIARLPGLDVEIPTRDFPVAGVRGPIGTKGSLVLLAEEEPLLCPTLSPTTLNLTPPQKKKKKSCYRYLKELIKLMPDDW
jgi:hypothetical protein